MGAARAGLYLHNQGHSLAVETASPWTQPRGDSLAMVSKACGDRTVKTQAGAGRPSNQRPKGRRECGNLILPQRRAREQLACNSVKTRVTVVLAGHLAQPVPLKDSCSGEPASVSRSERSVCAAPRLRPKDHCLPGGAVLSPPRKGRTCGLCCQRRRLRGHPQQEVPLQAAALRGPLCC